MRSILVVVRRPEQVKEQGDEGIQLLEIRELLHLYVAPIQASFTPDGNQYRCGCHAIRHNLPIGNIRERGVFDNIREGTSYLDNLPQEEYCYGCA